MFLSHEDGYVGDRQYCGKSLMENSVLVGIITPQYWPSRGPSALYFHALVHGLAGIGTKVLLFCAGRPEASDLALTGLCAVRCGDDLGAGLTRWRRVVRLAYFHGRAFMFVLKKRTNVSVWVVDGPLYWNFGAILALLVLRKRVVYLVHDVYPDVLVHAGLLQQGGFFVRLFEWLECLPMRQACQVFALSDGMTEALIKRLPKGCAVATLPFPVHPIFFECKPHKTASVQKRDKPVLLYAGGLGIAHYLDPFLAWSKKLGGQDGLIGFRIVADYARKQEIVEADELDKRSPVSWQELPALYADCSAGYVGLPPNWGDGSLPSKVFSILACGKPVLVVADEASELYRMVCTERLGLALSHEEALTGLGMAKLQRFLLNEDSLAACGERAKTFALGCCSPQTIAQILIDSTIP